MSATLGRKAPEDALGTGSRPPHRGAAPGWFAAVVLTAGLVAVALAQPQPPTEPQPPAAPRSQAEPQAAETPPSSTTPTTIGEEPDTTGFLEPVARTILGAPTYGCIMKIVVEEGEQVSEGQLLVQLDERGRQLEYERAQLAAKDESDVEQAQLSAKYGLQEYERQKRAFDSSTTPTISQSDLETFLLKSRLAQAAHKTRLADLALRQKVMELRLYEWEITRIRAPFAGTVARKIAEVGQVAELATPLLELIDTHQLYFVIRLPAAELRHVSVGQQAQVTPEFFPELAAGGRVVVVGPEVDAGGNTVRVKVLVDNRDGKLRPGLLARVSFTGSGEAPEQASPPPGGGRPQAAAPSHTEEPQR